MRACLVYRRFRFFCFTHFTYRCLSMRRKTRHQQPSRSFPLRLNLIAQILIPVFAAGFALPSLAQSAPQSVPQSTNEKELANTKTNNPKSSAEKSTGSKPAPLKQEMNAPTIIEAEKITGRPERFVHLDDGVEVNKGGLNLKADKAIYRNLEDEIDATGNVSLRRNGDCYSGDKISFQLDANSGFILNPVYRLLLSNAQGSAERVDFESQQRSIITKGTYSTCEGLDPDWYLQVDTLKLDTGLDTGVAGKSTLFFKGVPILSAPSFLPLSFSLSGARQSGFLPPVFGASSKGGTEITTPYYLNIAPNRDFTVYPKYIQRRGLQLGLEGRYLGETYAGETSVEGLLDDQQTGRNRYAVTSAHEQKVTPEFIFSWNVNTASDDNYPTDFSHSIAKTSQRLLLRELNASYFGSFWNLAIRNTNYQVLQDVSSPIARPYDRLPQISFHAEQFDVAGFDWALDTSFTRFWHPSLVRGNRTIVNPQLSYPIVQPGFFIVPKVALHATDYQLENQTPGKRTSFQRTLPTFSVDSGLIFERQSTFFGDALTQTLEPRLFYVNTPFRDQQALPNFDSALSDFNFAQMFSPNRFTGQDRIGDSNQVTAALTSRFIEVDGEERAKLTIGQRFYFNSQLVTLNQTVNDRRSDLLIAASGRLSKELSAETSLQINQSNHQAVMSNYGLSWRPADKKVLNLEYRYQRATLEQIDFSAQWPLADRWYAVARSNYSTRDKKLVEGLVGFEYKADCWSLRLVAQRFSTTSINNTSAFFVQLELNGLSKIGSSPIDVLKKNISGYQPLN